jgi:K+-sensing histidine kinase KdpD
VQAITRSANDGAELVRKLVSGAWVFGGSPPAQRPAASARLSDVWGRVLTWAAERYPERPYSADPAPGVIVGVDSLTLETLLTTLFGNALHHGDPSSPVAVTWGERADQIQLTVRNAGALPFPDFRALQPLDHRARGALGIGLYAARCLADVHGVGIDVRTHGPEVEATLTLPR